MAFLLSETISYVFFNGYYYMHTSARENFELFYNVYFKYLPQNRVTKIVEIGSLDVNGGLKKIIKKDCDYIGVDFVQGPGVDLVLEDPYILPFADESADVMVSSSCFEHSEMFWIVFLEILRVLKPDGLFYVNAPSNGVFHRYPVDCWRFYPDSGRALVTWAKRNGIEAVLLESYISCQTQSEDGFWNDYVGVFGKSAASAEKYKDRIVDVKADFYNGIVYGNDNILRSSELPEDLARLNTIRQISQRSIRFV